MANQLKTKDFCQVWFTRRAKNTLKLATYSDFTGGLFWVVILLDIDEKRLDRFRRFIESAAPLIRRLRKRISSPHPSGLLAAPESSRTTYKSLHP
jgi:hypothetical protein